MDTKEKKGIKINIYNLISILTLLVMGIGSSFAYFNAQMAEVKSDEISVSSLKLVVNLKIIPLYTELKLLPTNDDDIYKAIKNKCFDYVGNGACIAYEVEIENIGQENDGYLTFKYESNEIRNLSYLVLDDINLNDDLSLEDIKEATLQPASAAGNTDEIIGNGSFKMSSNQTKKVIIVLWISNLNKPQDEEQGGTFTGVISFNSSYGARITGTMNKTIITEDIK